MRVSHSFPAISATFDDPNLVSCAGLAPTMALAQRAGLGDLVAEHHETADLAATLVDRSLVGARRRRDMRVDASREVEHALARRLDAHREIDDAHSGK